MQEQKDFDILEMPAEGLAAYWLSIKKLIDVKKSKKVLDDEIKYTREPFIKYLLEIVFSNLDEPLIRNLIEAKIDVLCNEYSCKLSAMTTALIAMSSTENPRITFVRMASQFPVSLISEKKAFSLAHGLLDGLHDKNSNHKILLEFDHKMPSDRLLVKLLFHIILCRKEGKHELECFLPYIKTPYYSYGLTQVIDGFDGRAIRDNLQSQSGEILKFSKRKMAMATEMCFGIRNKLNYDDIFKIARSYMV